MEAMQKTRCDEVRRLEQQWTAEDHERTKRNASQQVLRDRAQRTKKKLRVLLGGDPADLSALAKSLVDTAAAWRVYPGADAYWMHRLEPLDRAGKLSEVLWRAALDGAPTSELVALLREVLALTKAQEGEPRVLVRYFQELDRYFYEHLIVGVPTWSPPSVWRQVNAGVTAALRRKAGEQSEGRLHGKQVGPVEPITWNRRDDGSVLVRKGNYERCITARALVRLFVTVADMTPRKVCFDDILRSWMEEDGIARVTSEDTLRRNGNRIKKELKELGVDWEQDGHSASWVPPR